jgi:hypothetical protein
VKRDANAERFKRPDPWADPRAWVEWWQHIVGFPQIEAVEWLREEGRKSWQHAIVYELVYGVEVTVGYQPRTPYVEQYRRGKWWLEILIKAVGRYDANYVAVLEWADKANVRARDPHPITGEDRHDLSVLVDDASIVDNPETIRICVLPTVIRLERLDHVLRRRRQFVDLARSLAIEDSQALVDWELDPLLLLRSEDSPLCEGMRQSELKGEMVEGGTEIVHCISDDDAESGGGLLTNLQPKDVVSGIRRVYFAQDRVGLARKVGFESPCELVEMFLRPLTLELWSIERRHGVYSHHELMSMNCADG